MADEVRLAAHVYKTVHGPHFHTHDRRDAVPALIDKGLELVGNGIFDVDGGFEATALATASPSRPVLNVVVAIEIRVRVSPKWIDDSPMLVLETVPEHDAPALDELAHF